MLVAGTERSGKALNESLTKGKRKKAEFALRTMRAYDIVKSLFSKTTVDLIVILGLA